MSTDHYTRILLTVIAGALLYLCVILTPGPVAHAQQVGARPGDYTGPAEVVIVGARLGNRPLDVRVEGQVEVKGTVTAQQRPETPDRVVLVGWEDQMQMAHKFPPPPSSTAPLPTTGR